MTEQEFYIAEAVEHAAGALLWQASDATDEGNGFPIGDDENGQLRGETQYIAKVIDQVPYLTEAVTAFVKANWKLLLRGKVTAPQCGHDIILTANRHGAGFWDRGLDMPATDTEAYLAWTRTQLKPYPESRDAWQAWLKERRPAPADYPQTVGDELTKDAHGYSFDAEFALNDDGEVDWLMAENVVLVDERNWSSDHASDSKTSG
jgi:hypothetical protein